MNGVEKIIQVLKDAGYIRGYKLDMHTFNLLLELYMENTGKKKDEAIKDVMSELYKLGYFVADGA